MVTVVTGASGFIGSHLVRELLARDRTVRVLVHSSSDAFEGLDVEQTRGDVRDLESLRRAFEGADVVYHLAAMISLIGPRGGRVPDINVTGARNAATAALEAGVRRFVHFSSIHAFDINGIDGPVSEESPRSGPGSLAYDRSKAEGEAAVRELVDRGLDAVIVNPAGVLGPGDLEPSRMGQLFLDLYRRKLPALVEGGFIWVDVRDVVSAALAAEERGRTGESYLLGGAWHSAAELGQFAEEVTGVRSPRAVLPMWLARCFAPPMDLVGRLFDFEPRFNSESLHALRATREIDNSKARRELGFDPRPVPESVRDIYRSWQEVGMIGELP